MGTKWRVCAVRGTFESYSQSGTENCVELVVVDVDVVKFVLRVRVQVHGWCIGRRISAGIGQEVNEGTMLCSTK